MLTKNCEHFSDMIVYEINYSEQVKEDSSAC
jgi:hypothetical protein